MSKQTPPATGVFLDHVAVATADPARLKRVLTLIGLIDEGQEPVPSQGVLTHFLRAGDGAAAVELLEPTDPQGVVAKYLAKKGPGIHHLCVRVPDVAASCRLLAENQIRLIYAEPQPGAHGCLVNFIHPESTGGVLLELSQKAV